ncbi:MAG TPA: Hsp20/alpha crystallin family protein [Candidatus Hydrogenedentes bacterium]|jgi:HSP20 family protein|nr:Hsp20/alpha crystallin family protein [Candidatus Hydrogenedentota bacterium]HPJ99203.1 Hsp20/alpha crystallin family protein [Candidatus Hydrogenedentota bacterium]
MTKLLPVHWRSSVDELRDRVVQTFDRWLPEDWRREPRIDMRDWALQLMARGGPTIDLEETDDEIVVTAELPGLDKDDFKVEVEGQRLILRGERKSAREKERRQYHCCECSYGSFCRAIALPCEIDPAQSTANYRKGVLTVTMPKTPAAKARCVRVTID